MANNLLIIMADEHTREFSGAYDHPVIKTPNLSKLADRGTRFDAAYTPSPICVPARAAMQTGRYIHEIEAWDSAKPYDGSVKSFGHYIRGDGARCASVGKLHFRSRSDDNGYDPEIDPLHVVNETGWVTGLLRDPLPDYRDEASELARDIGPGDSSYLNYDRRITQSACDWINQNAENSDTPWVLFVSFVAPHYPLIAPPEFYHLYDRCEIEPPRHHAQAFDHPVLSKMRDFWCYQDYFNQETQRVAQQAYFGLVSFMDDNVGKLLSALDATGSADKTSVIYTSDHGELLGNHGLWCKSFMYEEAVGIPMIAAGPEFPVASQCETPTSLIDIYQTSLDLTDSATDERRTAHSRSLMDLAHGSDKDRHVISEYHDGGSPVGFAMIRFENWKYIQYAGDADPQLFDLENDPHEMKNRADDPQCADVLLRGSRLLGSYLDVDTVSEIAMNDQKERLETLGGRDHVQSMFRFNHTPAPE